MKQRVTRRTLLGGIGAVIALGAVPTQVSATGDPDDFIGVGENEVDADGDGNTGVKVYVASDPEGGRGSRNRVTLISSDGKSTGDYATSVIAVGHRRFDSIDGTIKYDYYAGANNQNAAPDEVWLLVEDQQGNEHVLFDTINDGEPSAQEWKTANVFANTSHPNWYELKEDGSDEDDAGEIVEYTVTGSDVIKRLGVGRGNFGGDIVSEVYYDNPRIDGEKVGEFPANGTKKGNGRGRSGGGGPP